jgi:hypothetical protein
VTDLFGSGLPAHRKPVRPLEMRDFQPDDEGEPRIPHWRLAEVLEYARGSHGAQQYIERNKADFEYFGKLPHREEVSRRGPSGIEYLLNFNQAIWFVSRSDAPNARPIQRHVVEIYGLWARGKFHPIDDETEAAANTSFARAFEQSPDLMAMLQDLLSNATGLVLSQGKENGARIESVQRTALEIQGRLADIVKRRAAPLKNQDIYDTVVVDFYGGRCPCCSRSDRVIIRDNQRTKLYTLDHATDNPYKNALHEMWPVCTHCNSKFKHDARFRAEMVDCFRVFQARVEDVLGRKLI